MCVCVRGEEQKEGQTDNRVRDRDRESTYERWLGSPGHRKSQLADTKVWPTLVNNKKQLPMVKQFLFISILSFPGTGSHPFVLVLTM